MLSYVIGTVKEIFNEYISFEVNDIGFKVFVINPKFFVVEERIKLFVCDYFNQEEIFIYGFLNFKELIMFKKLKLVNGIGPKIALEILNNISLDRLIYLINKKSIIELKKIKGIGNKADSIVIKLANKLNEFNNNIFEYENIYKALEKLGYETAKINNVIYNLEDGLKEEDALKIAIRKLSNE